MCCIIVLYNILASMNMFVGGVALFSCKHYAGVNELYDKWGFWGATKKELYDTLQIFAQLAPTGHSQISTRKKSKNVIRYKIKGQSH